MDFCRRTNGGEAAALRVSLRESLRLGESLRRDPSSSAAGGLLSMTTLVGPSHAFVVGPAAAFRNNPVYDLVGVGDVASLAVHTIGEIYFKLAAAGFLGDFIDRCGAKILAGIAVFFDAFGDANIGGEHVQVAGLIVVMTRAGMIDVG